MKAYDRWTVLPHSPFRKLEENLWWIEGSLPNMPLKRATVVARLASGQLVVHNALAVDDATRAELEAWGTPAHLIVGNGWHRLDAKVFKDRYPALRVYCANGSKKRVAEVVPVDGGFADFPADPTVRMIPLEGVPVEGVLEVKSQAGTTLVFNDAVFNQPHLPGAFGAIYRLIGSSGGPRVTKLVKLAMVKDKRAFRAHLERLADTPRLHRIVMAHGQILDEAPAERLRRVAQSI
jgi:hypothetical protein